MVRGALLAVLMVAGGSLAAHAQTVTPKKTDQSIEDPINRNPMVIFIAEGPPNSCGPGCNRWIAADGDFDRGSSKRFVKFLDDHKDLNLPVYFHSLGGYTDQAISIGRHLRWLRISAGVGRTALQRCTGPATSSDCRRLVETTNDRLAQLRIGEGVCASSCVYAFIGATSRAVDPQARIGVHASRFIRFRGKEAVAVSNTKLTTSERAAHEQRTRDLWRYIGEMGADPGLVDFAAKIDPNAIRLLNRNELLRFGIVSTDRFETPWIGSDQTPNASYTLFKILTSRAAQDGNVNLNTTVGITCYRRERVTIYIERELAAGEKGHEPIIRVLSDGNEAWVSTNRINVNSRTDYRAEIIEFEEVMRLVPKRSFELKLDYPTPEWASKSATIKLSIAGFESALKAMRRECDRIHAPSPKPEAARAAAQRPPAIHLIDGPSENCNFVICETPWTERREGSQTYILFKTLTRKSSATGETLSTTIGLSCRTRHEVDVFVGRTPGRDEGPTGPSIRVVSDGTVVWMSKERTGTDAKLDYRSQVIPFREVLSTAPRSSLEYIETFEGPSAKRSFSAKISIDGLKAALFKMEQHCAQIQPTTPQSAQAEQ